MKPILKPVRIIHDDPDGIILISFLSLAELEALGTDLLEEEEMPSYLKDTTALPDFVDEAPVDAETVRWKPLFSLGRD